MGGFSVKKNKRVKEKRSLYWAGGWEERPKVAGGGVDK